MARIIAFPFNLKGHLLSQNRTLIEMETGFEQGPFGRRRCLLRGHKQTSEMSSQCPLCPPKTDVGSASASPFGWSFMTHALAVH
jgi:hypothetical protein